MKKWSLSLIAILWTAVVWSQHNFKAYIFGNDTKEPLIGAQVFFEAYEKGGVSDQNGLVEVANLPNPSAEWREGKTKVRVYYLGYTAKEIEIILPQTEPLEIVLFPKEQELETITVSTTRSSRSIDDIPTRLETIAGEELGEKAFMNATNISLLLRESTGIQMQQTSANSANQSIRIQGLDGRYTQLLKDGFPNFGGFSSGLSIMQIPPLDLQSVEVIKGSASTLYGGGAIAGLINLISKRPTREPLLELMLSQTHALGTTLNGFYAQRGDKFGVSLYASAHRQQAYDANGDDFSDLPEVQSFAFNPAFYYYPDASSTVRLAVNLVIDDRVGGDLMAIDDRMNESHPFFEQNETLRLSTQLSYEKNFSENIRLSLRNSVNYFDRTLEQPVFDFGGQQWASFSEASFSANLNQSEWIIGANVWTDQFTEDAALESQKRDYANHTYGVFAQNIWQISPVIALESGLRVDYNDEYDWFVLPRLNLLLDFNQNWTSRIGGGLGYKVPTIFTEASESLSFQQIAPIDPFSINAERSIGFNADVNYKTVLFDALTFSLNNLLFYTRIDDPLVLRSNGSMLAFENANGQVDTRGLETNLKMTYQDLKLFLQYAFIDARVENEWTKQQKVLTPKHNAGAVLMYESEAWRIGYEVYYTGMQLLSDGSRSTDYWMMGFLAARQIGKFNVFVNFENFLDTRIHKYQEVVLPPVNDPTFTEIWAPTDGFIFTAGVRWKIFGTDEHEHHDHD